MILQYEESCWSLYEDCLTSYGKSYLSFLPSELFAQVLSLSLSRPISCMKCGPLRSSSKCHLLQLIEYLIHLRWNDPRAGLTYLPNLSSEEAQNVIPSLVSLSHFSRCDCACSGFCGCVSLQEESMTLLKEENTLYSTTTKGMLLQWGWDGKMRRRLHCGLANPWGLTPLPDGAVLCAATGKCYRFSVLLSHSVLLSSLRRAQIAL
jgi:hypothetical protein